MPSSTKGSGLPRSSRPRTVLAATLKEGEEFAHSHHSKGGRILGSLDNVLAEVVEGNRGMITPAFQSGNSAAAVVGCWQCHGSEVKVLPGGKLDPATWPNTGIGRINPDGSEGSCSACHSRHSFSAYQARHPDNCGKCHMGPDHPQMEIYYESKHGIAFRAFKDKLNMDSSKWVVGEDYNLAPTCATCHMSATPTRPATKDRPATPGMPVTHDVGMRISWNNRPAVSVRPEVSDAKMGLPGADVNWQTRRNNMKNVCINCHEQQWVDNFYVQYDSLIDLYHEKFAKPGLELYQLAKPLMRPAELLQPSGLDLVRDLAPRGTPRPARRLDDGPGLHALARHLRGGQALLFRDGPGTRAPCRSRAAVRGSLKRRPPRRRSARSSKRCSTPTTTAGISTNSTRQKSSSESSGKRNSRIATANNRRDLRVPLRLSQKSRSACGS